jgi:methylated-DNA-[protein]-cysteine S-methyltransferase
VSPIRVVTLDSPIGRITAGVRDGVLCAMAVGEHWARLARRLASAPLVPADDAAGVAAAVRRYFAGDVDAIASLPVAPDGTAFQRAVWAALREIPAGETRSYGDIARAIGAPTAVRAVGAANGANPIWLVVPCHRVIGADGSLTGYGGGLDRKRWLLAHERTARPRAAALL